MAGGCDLGQCQGAVATTSLGGQGMACIIWAAGPFLDLFWPGEQVSRGGH